MIRLLGKDLQHSLAERETLILGLKKLPKKCIVLQTCNRVKLYIGDGEVDQMVVNHLFRVVSGLESAMVGETAIQGQVKQAYLRSIEEKRISRGLHYLFQNALKVGKIVRTETKISHGAVSHSHAAVEIMKRDRVDFSKARILLIGVSNINVDVISHLVKKGSKTIFMANRTYSKALELSDKFNCEAIKLDKIYENIRKADIMIAATKAPHTIIKKEKFKNGKKITIFDLAVPRDVDPEIGEYESVVLYNIEDIEKRININKEGRKKEIEAAEKIIEEEMKKCYG